MLYHPVYIEGENENEKLESLIFWLQWPSNYRELQAGWENLVYGGHHIWKVAHIEHENSLSPSTNMQSSVSGSKPKKAFTCIFTIGRELTFDLFFFIGGEIAFATLSVLAVRLCKTDVVSIPTSLFEHW